MSDDINWTEARGRIEFAGDILGAPEDDVRQLVQIPDDALNHGDPWPLVHFARRHGVSLDWLVCGDLRGVLLSASKALGYLR